MPIPSPIIEMRTMRMPDLRVGSVRFVATATLQGLVQLRHRSVVCAVCQETRFQHRLLKLRLGLQHHWYHFLHRLHHYLVHHRDQAAHLMGTVILSPLHAVHARSSIIRLSAFVKCASHRYLQSHNVLGTTTRRNLHPHHDRCLPCRQQRIQPTCSSSSVSEKAVTRPCTPF